LKYSEDFVKRVKDIHPNDTELHESLDCGGALVGRILNDDALKQKINPRTILRLLDQNKPTKLWAIAKVAQARIDLYVEWKKIAKG